MDVNEPISQIWPNSGCLRWWGMSIPWKTSVGIARSSPERTMFQLAISTPFSFCTLHKCWLEIVISPCAILLIINREAISSVTPVHTSTRSFSGVSQANWTCQPVDLIGFCPFLTRTAFNRQHLSDNISYSWTEGSFLKSRGSTTVRLMYVKRFPFLSAVSRLFFRYTSKRYTWRQV